MVRKNVVIGLLGSTLDSGHNAQRWKRWRPSIGICQQAELRVDRFELLVPGGGARLTQQVIADLAQVAPDTQVVPHEIELADPWDFSEVYAALDKFAEDYPWRTASEDYYLHISTGTHVMQICLFLLCETRAMPGVLVQSSPGRRGEPDRNPAGRIDVIDLELAK